MLVRLVTMLIDSVATFFTVMLLTRVLMRWVRISFINPLGQFVLATTDWAVRPMQRLVPSGAGLDLSCWLPAWLIQIASVLIPALFFSDLNNPAGLLFAALVIGATEVLRSLLQLILIVVIATAVLSWVNPQAPVAPLLRALARPFLAPVARRLPPVGGVDLSPLVVLLVVQMLLFLLANLRASLALLFA